MQKDSSLPCAAWGKTDASCCCGCKQKTHSKAELAIHTITPYLHVGFLILCLAFSSGISILFCKMTSHCNRSFCSKGMLILKVGFWVFLFVYLLFGVFPTNLCSFVLWKSWTQHVCFGFKETLEWKCESLIVGLETQKSLLICVKKQR